MAKLAFMALLALLSPHLLLAQMLEPVQRELTPTYQWIVENNQVIGCLEQKHLLPPEDEMCRNLPYASMECAGYESRNLIRDLKVCRTKLGATAYFVGKEALLCAEFVEDGDGPRRRRVLLRHVPREECTHGWVELDPTCQVQATGDFPFHPLSGFGLGDLIPEIMNLRDGQTIPPGVYEKYDTRRIAITLQWRNYQQREQASSEQNRGRAHRDFLNHSQIQMAFNDRNLDSILRNGFLNQHQIAQTNGTMSPQFRAETEDEMLGLRVEAPREYGSPRTRSEEDRTRPQNRLRPKYAYFGQQAAQPERSTFGRIFPHYGNIIAVMQNQVKDRTTFTSGDSLGTSDTSNTHSPRAQMAIDPDKLKRVILTYMEAQVWGELGVNDVAYFIVNCPSLSDPGPLSQEIIDKLKATGKPVYSCREESSVTSVPSFMGMAPPVSPGGAVTVATPPAGYAFGEYPGGYPMTAPSSGATPPMAPPPPPPMVEIERVVKIERAERL